MMRLLVRLATLVGALGVLAVALHAQDDGYRLRLQSDDVAGLRKDFLVKIAGTPVGEVEDVELDAGDHAVVTLRLDDEAAPVGRDARAAIRASNLLGEKYVDLQPGDARRPAPSGHLITRDRTTTPSDLDDVLSVLDADTRVALASFLVGQGKALGGNGRAISAALRHLPPALDEATQLVDGLAVGNQQLGSLVERTDRVLVTVGRERPALGRLVDSAGGALAALDGRADDLADTVREAPGLVRRLRATLDELEHAARPLGPAANGLEMTAEPLTATLRALPGFAEAARPALQTAREVSPALTRLGDRAAPVVRRLAPAASDLRRFADASDPVTRVLDHGIADVLGVLQGWARAIQNTDGAGHVFRVNAVVGSDVLNAVRRYIEDGGRRKRTPRRGSRDPRPPRRESAAPAPSPPARRDDGRPPLPALRLPELRLPTGPVQLPDVDPDDVVDGVQPLLDFLLKP